MSKRVSFSCDGNEFEYPTSLNFNKVGENCRRNKYKTRRLIIGVWSTRVSPSSDYRRSSSSSSGFSSAERFVKGVGAKVARALSFVSLIKITRSSRKVCNSSSTITNNNLVRSRSYAEPLDDSHRAEAIQDCIQFFNSSSSLHKSNSIS